MQTVPKHNGVKVSIDDSEKERGMPMSKQNNKYSSGKALEAQWRAY